MRILFMHHFSLSSSSVGQLVRLWSLALRAAGHECRLIVLAKESDVTPGVRTIICRQGDPTADLPFNAPTFSTCDQTENALRFNSLSDGQLTLYRERIRRHLDIEIDQFDPHVIHAQHIWLQGQLALETGVPYLLSAWGPELIDYALDPRYRALADQAAENAGRILAPDKAIFQQVVQTFDAVADRTLPLSAALLPNSPAALPNEPAEMSKQLLSLYQAVLDERFGARC